MKTDLIWAVGAVAVALLAIRIFSPRGWARILGFMASALVGTAVTCVTLAAGLFGSLYSTNVKTALKELVPVADDHGGLLAAGLLVIAVLLYFFRQHATDTVQAEAQKRLDDATKSQTEAQKRLESAIEKQSEAQQRLESATEKLETIIRTQPPVEFQRQFGLYYEKAQVACDETETAEDIADSIRVVIEGLADLAKVFDDGADEDSYGVNLMLFFTPPEGAEWFELIMFLDDGVALEKLRGLLGLFPPFSAKKCGAAPAQSPDTGLAAFALPIPLQPGVEKVNHGTGWRVLPGGPRAYLHGSFEHFSPTTDLAKWCKDDGDFPQYVINRIDDYFTAVASAGICGFFSVPVCRPTSEFQKAGHREVVAVLNVHWSAGRLFEQERSAKAFAQAIFPMCALLGRQITSWFEKAGGKPKPPPQQPLPPPEPPQLPPAPQVPPPAAVT